MAENNKLIWIVVPEGEILYDETRNKMLKDFEKHDNLCIIETNYVVETMKNTDGEDALFELLKDVQVHQTPVANTGVYDLYRIILVSNSSIENASRISRKIKERINFIRSKYGNLSEDRVLQLDELVRLDDINNAIGFHSMYVSINTTSPDKNKRMRMLSSTIGFPFVEIDAGFSLICDDFFFAKDFGDTIYDLYFINSGSDIYDLGGNILAIKFQNTSVADRIAVGDMVYCHPFATNHDKSIIGSVLSKGTKFALVTIDDKVYNNPEYKDYLNALFESRTVFLGTAGIAGPGYYNEFAYIQHDKKTQSESRLEDLQKLRNYIIESKNTIKSLEEDINKADRILEELLVREYGLYGEEEK